jgi:hypothetical protein
MLLPRVFHRAVEKPFIRGKVTTVTGPRGPIQWNRAEMHPVAGRRFFAFTPRSFPTRAFAAAARQLQPA